MRLLWSIVALSLFSLAPVAAQVTGRLTGTVVDTSGAAIPGVEVKLMLAGQPRPILTAVTTGDGIFSIGGIRPEIYDITVESVGFRKQTVRSIKIDPASEAALPAIKLEIGAVTETVEVTASSQRVQTGNAEIATTVTNEQLSKLPTLNRSPLALVRTQIGVTTGRSANTIINGQRTSFTNVTIDGINIQDNFLRDNALDFLPNLLLLDQVSEVTVATSNASSAFGFGASQMIFVTPSGTNTLHGGAFWSNQNYKTSANTWFNNQRGIDRAPLNQNQLGGSIGGAIFKNKLFFYSNYEAYRLRQQLSSTRTVLTTEARQGIYTYRDTGGAVRKANVLQLAGQTADPTVQQLLQQVPGQDKINNFTTGDSRSDLIRNTGGYSFLAQKNRTRDNVTGKLDYVLSTRHVFSGTYAWNRDNNDRPDTANDYSVTPKVVNPDRRTLVSANWRWNPVPSLTNEVRGGFNRSTAIFDTSEKFGPYLLGGLLFGNPVNTLLREGRYANSYHAADNANWVRGRHNVQFGFQMQRITVDAFDRIGTLPTYTLGIGTGNPGLTAAQLPGISAADLTGANNLLANIAGYVTAYTQAFNVTSRTSGFVKGADNERNYSLNNYAFYGQDSWKIQPRLTLNLGLRYDYYTPVDERDALRLLPVIQNGDIIGTMFSNSTLDFAGSAVGRPWYNRDLNNFAPNVGLAWDVSGAGKTVFRAAYSVSFVEDENIRALDNTTTTNTGLQSTSAKTGLTGLLRNGPPAIPTPVFKVPRLLSDNYALSTASALAMPDPNLRTPYVQQWSIGFQRQIKGSVLEARYVGNHATKQFRAFDFNQIDIQSNGFLDDFRRAYNNAAVSAQQTGRFDPSYSGPGSQPLTVFPKISQGGLLTNATVVNLIQTGQVGNLAHTYQTSQLNGGVNFYRNPNILGANLMTNYSNATYNALQIDFRKQTNRGLYLQSNYTYSKVLSDSSGEGSIRFEPFLDNQNAKIERARTVNDLTHVIKANGAYDLPIGKGHRVDWRPLSRVMSGWTVASLMIWQSGGPFSILSSRDTLNRSGRSTNNTANSALNKSQLDDLLQFRMTGSGPVMVADSALAPDGRAVGPDGAAAFSGQVFSNPVAGTLGGLQRRMFSGPWTFNMDMSASKRTRITERQSVELRMDAQNIFNHATFAVADQSINSTQFGRIASNFFGRRIFQFGLSYKF